ncbi:MAG TPA: M28 family peptidase [Acidimicrobiia bacterium]|nr:M28 family peptidase [Acidimicrobiia bacterium]
MSRFEESAWSIAIIAAAFVIGALVLVRPGMPSDPTADEFSAERAMRHVAEVAQVPHPLGSVENAAVREYLVEELTALGLSPELQTVPATDYFGTGGQIEAFNVMARIPGSASSGSVLLMAHYDSHPATPGANDNATAVAALLETGRALLAGEPLTNDVILLFTDGEEPAPQYGASAFVADHPWMAEVAFAMNFEAAGESGPSVLVQTGEAQAWTIDRIAAGVSRPAAFSFLTATVALFGEIGTDFDAFLAAGTEGIHVSYLRGSSIYHTQRDNLDRVSLRSMQHHGAYALGLTRELGGIDLAAAQAEREATFFTMAPGMVVRYPAAWAVPLALLTLLTAMAAEMREARLRTVFARAGVAFLGVIGMAVLATLVWLVIVAVRPEMGVAEAYVYAVGVLGAMLAFLWWWRRRRAGTSGPRGEVVLWALLAVAASLGMPGMAYLFTWPALVAAVSLLAWPVTSATAARLRLFVVATVVATIVVPALDVFLAMAQPRPGNLDSELTATFAVVALLAMLAAELVLRFVRPEATPTSDGDPGQLEVAAITSA